MALIDGPRGDRLVAPQIAFGLGLTAVSIARIATSYKALEMGASSLDVGIVAGGFGFLAVFVAIPIGRAVDRAGERVFFLVGMGLIGLSPLVAGLASGIPILVVSQALLGLGQAGLAISMQTIAAHGQTPLLVDRRFSDVALVQSMSQLVGPVVAGLAIASTLTVFSLRRSGLAYIVAALTVLIGLGLAAVTVRATEMRSSGATAPSVSVRRILEGKGVPGSLTASVSVLVSIDILVAYLPVLGEERGLSPGFVGALLSMRAAAGLLARPLVTPLLRWLGRRMVLVLTLVMMAASMTLVPFVTNHVALLAVMAVLGFGINLGAPLTASWMAASVSNDAKGAALALRMSANRAAQVLVPAALGALAVGAGTAALFVAGGVGLILTSQLVRRALPE